MDTGQLFALGIAVLLIWMLVMLFLAKPVWFKKFKDALCHCTCCFHYQSNECNQQTEMKKVVIDPSHPSQILLIEAQDGLMIYESHIDSVNTPTNDISTIVEEENDDDDSQNAID